MVGIVVVSHSAALADGVVELARQMGGDELRLEAAGGLEDGSIGTDAERVRAAIERAMSDDGVLVLMDLGSALMSAEMAVELLEADGRVELSEAPLVEGAVAAAVSARGGAHARRGAGRGEGAHRDEGGTARCRGMTPPAADTDGTAPGRIGPAGSYPGAQRDRTARPSGGARRRAREPLRCGPATRQGRAARVRSARAASPA